MYVTTIKSAALAAILVTVLVPGIASGVVLLSDSFDRPDNADVSADLPTGQAGSLAPVTYTEKDPAYISSNRVRLGKGTAGDTTWVVPNHDFVDLAITDGGGFVFEFDVDPVVGGNGTSGHWAAVSFGHSEASAKNTSSHHLFSGPFGITFTDTGTATAFLAGAGEDVVTIKEDPTGAEVYHVKITVEDITSFATGESGTVTVNVDGTDVYSDLTVGWTGANYINMEAYYGSSNLSDYDNLEIYTLGGGPDPIPGDANDDGVVDDEDASILAAHWQQEGNWGDGDFNNDGFVNDQDASILAAHWQEGSSEGGSPVPEPSTVVLLVFAAVSLFVWRRR